MISVYTKRRTRSCVNFIYVNMIMLTPNANTIAQSYQLKFINEKSYEIVLESESREALENVMNEVCCGTYCSRHGMVDLDQMISHQRDLATIAVL